MGWRSEIKIPIRQVIHQGWGLSSVLSALALIIPNGLIPLGISLGGVVQNPFEYGRELGPGELVDREAELAEVRATLLEGGKLFLIGPRRFGKTSIHNVAAQEARLAGGHVLRYNVEAFPQLTDLVSAIVVDAARVLTGPVELVTGTLARVFKRLRPSLTYSPLDQTWSVALGVETDSAPVPLLAQALHGLEEAAGEAGRPVGLILDEIQHIVTPSRSTAE
jgi:hypothetical protein